jgi:hypothetical protein
LAKGRGQGRQPGKGAQGRHEFFVDDLACLAEAAGVSVAALLAGASTARPYSPILKNLAAALGGLGVLSEEVIKSEYLSSQVLRGIVAGLRERLQAVA